MDFLFFLRLIIILASGFSYKSIVVDLQVNVDVPALLKVQGIVFAMFWGRPYFAAEDAGQRDEAELCLYFFRKDDVFCLKVVIDVAGHVCDPRMVHDLIEAWPLISLELKD